LAPGVNVLKKDTETNELRTEELMRLLENCHSFDELIQNTETSITDPNTPAFLANLLEKHGLTIQYVIKKANLSPSFGYQVFNGRRSPTRDILLRIAFAMRLTVDETQHLLKIAQRGELYPRVRRDAAIIFCLERNCSLCDAEELLESIGETSLS
jgi:transcriptional regulator with XRE-family HTH domain